jgi:hypothetical protein
MRIVVWRTLIALTCAWFPAVAALAQASPDIRNQAFPAEIAAWKETDFLAQRDAAVRLNKDLQEAIRRGDKTFVIPAGNYRFHPDSLPNLVIRDAHDLTIEAAGATFWLYPFQRVDGVLLVNCRHVVLRGLTVDYYPATYPQGDVIAIDPDKGFIDFQLAPGFSTPMDVPGHLAGAKLVHFDQQGNFLVNRLDWVREVQDLGQGRYRVYPKSGWAYKYKTAIAPGTVLALAGRSMRMAFHLQASAACTLEDSTLYASPHMAWTAMFGPTVEDCEFSRAGDDLMNIHGMLSLVYDQPAPDQVDVLAQVTPDLAPGTTLRFFDFDSLAARGEAKVLKAVPVKDQALAAAAATMITDRKLAFLKPACLIRVQLDRPASVSKYDVVTSDAGVAQGTVIRRNFLHDAPSRGILLKSIDGLIEGNRFANIGMGSIVISNDVDFMEGPFSTRITIQDNIVDKNGWSSLISRGDWIYAIGAISVTCERLKGLCESPVNFDIRVRNNRVKDSANCGIFMSNVAGGEVTGNTIIDAVCKEPLGLGTRMGLANPAYGLVIATCRDIDVHANQFESPGEFCRGSMAFVPPISNVGPQHPEEPK